MANKTVMDHYYTKLQTLVEEHSLSRFPELILNADETGVPLDFRPSKVVSPKRMKNVWAVSSGNKANITVMGCASAAGDVTDPIVIFKGKKVNDALKATSPSSWRVQFTDNGWMTAAAFEAWFVKLLIPYMYRRNVSSLRSSHSLHFFY